MKKDYGFQLYLSETDNQKLLPIITHLQHLYEQAPPFHPHLSIHGVVNAELETVIAVVNQVTTKTKKFVVEQDGFGFQSDNWARMLYIKIKENKNLSKLHHQLETGLGVLDTQPYTPHISLMYKDRLEKGERSRIIKGLNIPNRYTVSSVNILSAGSNNDRWRDYAKWKVEYHKTLV